jgi:hypothetical protein
LTLDPAAQLWTDVAGQYDKVSRAGESHPCALSELDVNLSAHTAPVMEPQLALQFPSAPTTWVPARRCAAANALTGVDVLGVSYISGRPTESRFGPEAGIADEASNDSSVRSTAPILE